MDEFRDELVKGEDDDDDESLSDYCETQFSTNNMNNPVVQFNKYSEENHESTTSSPSCF